MEALAFIPLIGSFLSSLFGKQSQETQSTTGSENITSAAGVNMAGTTTQNQTQNQVSNSESSQSTSGTTTGTGTNTQTGSVSRLDDSTKGQLTGAIQNLLGSLGTSSNALDSQINSVGGSNFDFDPNAFIRGIVDQASAQQRDSMESDLAAIGDNTGSNAGNNTMAALLKDRVSRNASANLAGIASQATQTAAGISKDLSESKTGQLASLTGTQSNILNSALGNLLNAGQTEVSMGSNSTTQNQSQNTSGNTKTTTDSTTNSTEKVNQVQQQTQSQQSNSSANGKAAKNDQDWTTFFSGIGNIFKTTF